jgi:hypothetical protein
MGEKDLSPFVLIRGNHETFNRLALDDSIETRSLPTLARCYPRQLYLDHSHCPVLAPATLAALPPTREIPDREVSYVAFPKSSIQPLGFAHLCRSRPRGSIREQAGYNCVGSMCSLF